LLCSFLMLHMPVSSLLLLEGFQMLLKWTVCLDLGESLIRCRNCSRLAVCRIFFFIWSDATKLFLSAAHHMLLHWTFIKYCSFHLTGNGKAGKAWANIGWDMESLRLNNCTLLSEA
jgi:hypothetical protein